MIEDTMLEAANTMKAAADEIVRLRRERDMLGQALRKALSFYSDMYGVPVDCENVTHNSETHGMFAFAREALASLERPS